jgi:hypothetical protein
MSEAGTAKSRGFDWIDVLQTAIAPVITALILGLAALAWNALSQGGLVRLLGGVTQEQLEATRIGHISPSDPYPLPGTEMPGGAIIGFYGDCPPGWARASREVGSIIGPKPDGTYASDSLKTSSSKKSAATKPSKNDFEAYAIFFCSKIGEEFNWGSPSK